MIDALNFVKGAVAKKDFVPVLTHVNINDGIIQAYNGRVLLSSPIDLDLNCSPRAVPFIKAVQTCKDSIAMNITPTGRLSVKSKGFKTLIECSQDPFPTAQLQGERIELPGEGFLEALRYLEPFIAEDDSRQWARGILFNGRTANATNNIVMLQLWLDYKFPVKINLPHQAVTELLRIKQEPVAMMVDENQATFIYENDRWLRSQLYNTEWPDIDKLYASLVDDAQPIPPGLFEAMREVQPFADEMARVYLSEDKVATSPHDEVATSSIVEGLAGESIYNIGQFLLLEKVATKFNFNGWPKPAIFYGDKLRGALVGIKF